jgi:hypothetical protein
MMMRKSKLKRGVKTTAKRATKKAKVSAKVKKVSAKKKRVVKGKAKIEKKKATKKTVKKETKKVKVKQEEEAKKKKVDRKTEKKITISIGEKVEEKTATSKPKRRITPKKVMPPKNAVLGVPRNVLHAEKEERYPPLPIEILPEEYGEDSIALMIVDPRKLFIYWEITAGTLKKYVGNVNIRLYDVTGVDFDGMNARSYLDIAVNNRIGSQYIDVEPEKEFIADIGIIDHTAVFITVARSNRTSTPRAEITEEGSLPHRLYETGLPIPPIGYKR